MANICCDDVCFFSDDNAEGVESLWKDLETAITPGYKDDLGNIRRLFLHAGIATDGIRLRGTIIDMGKNDTRILLSLDTAWRPLHDAYTAIANTYGVSFVMRSMEPGCGIFYNTKPIAFPLSCGAWSQAAAFSIIRMIPGVPFRTDTA